MYMSSIISSKSQSSAGRQRVCFLHGFRNDLIPLASPQWSIGSPVDTLQPRKGSANRRCSLHYSPGRAHRLPAVRFCRVPTGHRTMHIAKLHTFTRQSIVVEHVRIICCSAFIHLSQLRPSSVSKYSTIGTPPTVFVRILAGAVPLCIVIEVYSPPIRLACDAAGRSPAPVPTHTRGYCWGLDHSAAF
jgi:hypothetical protein